MLIYEVCLFVSYSEIFIYKLININKTIYVILESIFAYLHSKFDGIKIIFINLRLFIDIHICTYITRVFIKN